jgi:peptidyl-prolyl cis-trans isomerase D
MLQAMREGSKSPIMKIFLLFLAAGFALWGVGDITSGLFGRGDKAVEAGDSSVSAAEAATEFELVRRTNFPSIPVGQAIQLGLLGEVMGALARRTLVAAEADRLGLATTREMERDFIANEPSFQDELGNFSEGRFLAALGRSGLNEKDWLKRLDASLLSDQLVTSIAGGGRFSAPLATALAAFQLEKRQAVILSFPVNPALVEDPTAAQLETYFAENSAVYEAAALRDFSLIWLTAEEIAARISLAEEDVQLAYDTRLDEFSTPETRSVRQMVFDSEEAALAARERLGNPAGFNQLAGELLDWTEDDVRLGTVARSDLDGELAETVFAAPAGQLAGPAQTAFGWHLVIVDEIMAGKTPSLDEVRGEIEETLRGEEAYGVLVDRVNALEDALASGASLQEAARTTDLPLSELNGIDQNGRDIDGSAITGPLADLASDSAFLELAFSLDIDEISVIGESGEDSFFVVQPHRDIAARSRTLEEVRDRVRFDWQLGEAVKEARQAAEAAIQQGASAFANQPVSPQFQRSGAGLETADAQLIARTAFDLGKGEAALVEAGPAAYAVQLTQIEPADAETVANLADQLTLNLSAPVAEDIGAALSVDLSERFKLELNPGLVQQLLIGQPQ